MREPIRPRAVIDGPLQVGSRYCGAFYEPTIWFLCEAQLMCVKDYEAVHSGNGTRFERFIKAVDKILSISHKELQRRLKAEKKTRPKRKSTAKLKR